MNLRLAASQKLAGIKSVVVHIPGTFHKFDGVGGRSGRGITTQDAFGECSEAEVRTRGRGGSL